MNYAFMSFSTPELTLDAMLALAARLGYDGIEPRISAGHRHGIELDAGAASRAASRAAAAASGIALCCLATSCAYADPAQTADMLDATHRAIDLAGDVGAARIRVFGGQLGEGLSREAAIALLVAALSGVADHAAARGVTICLETHDAWCDPRHVAAVMRQVNHPAIRVNWDIMHPVRGEFATVRASFDLLRPYIAHLHVHDGEAGSGPLRPIGQGVVDHRTAIACLLAVNYPGYISGEWIGWEPYETHLPRELATLKGYEAAALTAPTRPA
ncbi:MAG TPA: sugar phosphate isomerase/epimerase family protein [Armatimonadota bacterium]|nr:sugar phosphate isomerase/epimerase family protein [Armatimonadota bacterium]HOS43230.1 sugar phosphate isomerase/epimerase family protein [Armatimonadota bacterium]